MGSLDAFCVHGAALQQISRLVGAVPAPLGALQTPLAHQGVLSVHPERLRLKPFFLLDVDGVNQERTLLAREHRGVCYALPGPTPLYSVRPV